MSPRIQLRSPFTAFNPYLKFDTFRPPDFKDVIAENSRKVKWRNIVGNDATLDDATTTDEEEEHMEEVLEDEAHVLAEKADRSVEPVAGPWAPVAKCLQYVFPI